MSLKVEEFLSSWGILWEGPVRKAVRSMIADILDVEGEQFPITAFIRKHVRAATREIKLR